MSWIKRIVERFNLGELLLVACAAGVIYWLEAAHVHILNLPLFILVLLLLSLGLAFGELFIRKTNGKPERKGDK